MSLESPLCKGRAGKSEQLVTRRLVSGKGSGEDCGAHTFPPPHRLQRAAENCALTRPGAFEAFALKS